jgi:ATP-dependent 26S proteasome regulatory subunit
VSATSAVDDHLRPDAHRSGSAHVERNDGVFPELADGLRGLRPALLRLDLRLRLAVDALRSDAAERARDPFRGLYLSVEDIDYLLADTPAVDVARRLLAEAPGVAAPRLGALAKRFGLDAFAQDALLICLAPDLDLRYERLYGYLQDDVTRRRPTVDLILRLLCPTPEQRLSAREQLGAGGRLGREVLIAPLDDAAGQAPLLSRPLRVAERVVEYLLGADAPDSRLAACCRVSSPASREAGTAGAEDPVLPAEVLRGAARLLGTPGASGPVVYLQGDPGSAKSAAARALCAVGGERCLLLDVPALLAGSHPPSLLLPLAVREALLQDAFLVVDGFDRLLADDPDSSAAAAHLRRLLQDHRLPAILVGETRWEPATWLPEAPAVRVELPAPGQDTRLRLWRAHFDGELAEEEATALAGQFRLDGEAIRAVATAARSRAIWRGDGRVAAEDVRAAARTVAAPPLEGLARRLEPRYGWDDIVLPPDARAQLRELCARARYQGLVLDTWGYGRKHARRRSLSALFAGQPGTGKTMAAEIVAGGLGLELYRIDLSAVVSKYIGETEKNLEKIFRAADQGDAVLLFDEADAIFGKRSEVRDAHDRYANVEIAYLLQRLEAYEGLAVLTTNLRGNIDEAFIRRLDCVLEFPLPEEAERLAIWRRALPAEAPLAPDADLPFLAQKFRLAGGHIRNIALTAGFLAAAEGGPIAMRHLVRATRREYQKLGKLVAEADFERYYPLLKDS